MQNNKIIYIRIPVTGTSGGETRPWGGVADQQTGSWAEHEPGAVSETYDETG